ncbi:MAG: BON domain-containing protein [Terracidiphilus sp.]|nr:BON domain-containing protein [Terracidiphilus sp.]
MKFIPPFMRYAGATAALAVMLMAGCKNQAPAAPNDAQIAGNIQTKLSNESALAGQDIHVAVQNGVATLSGTVISDAARALAGNESGTITGVKTVVNNLTVQAVSQPGMQPQMAAAPAPAPAQQKPSARPDRKYAAQSQPAQAPMQAPAPMQHAAQTPAPPPAPPRPIVKQVTLAAGTVVPVRVTETLDTKTTLTNDAFHGSLAGDLMADGVVAIPQGSPILGRVVDAKEAAHFKGSASLTLELTQLTARGQKLSLVTDPYSQQGAGRGKNTAIKAGGGAALGAIVGALAGGGKGAAIGTLAGAGAGTGINAATRGQQVVIPSETIIQFRLQSPITVTVTILPQGGIQNDAPYEPTLQKR